MAIDAERIERHSQRFLNLSDAMSDLKVSVSSAQIEAKTARENTEKLLKKLDWLQTELHEAELERIKRCGIDCPLVNRLADIESRDRENAQQRELISAIRAELSVTTVEKIKAIEGEQAAKNKARAALLGAITTVSIGLAIVVAEVVKYTIAGVPP